MNVDRIPIEADVGVIVKYPSLEACILILEMEAFEKFNHLAICDIGMLSYE